MESSSVWSDRAVLTKYDSWNYWKEVYKFVYLFSGQFIIRILYFSVAVRSGVVGAQFLGGPKVRIFRQRDNFSDKNVTVSGFDFYNSIRQRIENKPREKFDRLIFGFFRQKGENDEFSDKIFSGGPWPPLAPPATTPLAIRQYSQWPMIGRFPVYSPLYNRM